MITRGSLWLPLAILLLLAALSFWIERSVQLTETGSEASQTDPEGIMENFDALRTDPAGKPHYRLSAKKLKHYSGSRRTELESPPSSNSTPKPASECRGKAGHCLVDGDEVGATRRCRHRRAARPDNPAMTQRTEQLLVFPERDLLPRAGRRGNPRRHRNGARGAMEYDADNASSN